MQHASFNLNFFVTHWRQLHIPNIRDVRLTEQAWDSYCDQHTTDDAPATVQGPSRAALSVMGLQRMVHEFFLASPAVLPTVDRVVCLGFLDHVVENTSRGILQEVGRDVNCAIQDTALSWDEFKCRFLTWFTPLEDQILDIDDPSSTFTDHLTTPVDIRQSGAALQYKASLGHFLRKYSVGRYYLRHAAETTARLLAILHKPGDVRTDKELGELFEFVKTVGFVQQQRMNVELVPGSLALHIETQRTTHDSDSKQRGQTSLLKAHARTPSALSRRLSAQQRASLLHQQRKDRRESGGMRRFGGRKGIASRTQLVDYEHIDEDWDQAAKLLCRQLRVREYVQDEDVFTAGTEDNKCYIVLSGKFRVLSNKHIDALGVLSEGACFGWSAFADAAAGKHTVRTVTVTAFDRAVATESHEESSEDDVADDASTPTAPGTQPEPDMKAASSSTGNAAAATSGPVDVVKASGAPPGPRRVVGALITLDVDGFEKSLQWYRTKKLTARATLLASCRQLAGAPHDALLRVAKTAVLCSARTNDVVLQQNDKPDGVYVISRGRFRVIREVVVRDQFGRPVTSKFLEITTLTRGAMVGELAVCHTDALRSASLIASSHGMLLRLKSSEFLHLLRTCKQARQAVMQLASQGYPSDEQLLLKLKTDQEWERYKRRIAQAATSPSSHAKS